MSLHHFYATLLSKTRLHHFSTTYYSKTLVRHFSTTLFSITSPQQVSRTLFSNTSLQLLSPTRLSKTHHFSTTRLYNTCLQRFSPTTLYNASLHHSSPLLLYNTLLQHFYPTLPYTFSNTLLRHFPTAHKQVCVESYAWHEKITYAIPGITNAFHLSRQTHVSDQCTCRQCCPHKEKTYDDTSITWRIPLPLPRKIVAAKNVMSAKWCACHVKNNQWHLPNTLFGHTLEERN